MKKKQLLELKEYRDNLMLNKNEIEKLVQQLLISRLNLHQKSILTQIQNKIKEIQ